jgi:hypothetical protein
LLEILKPESSSSEVEASFRYVARFSRTRRLLSWGYRALRSLVGRCASTLLASVLLLPPSGFPLRRLESSRHRRPRDFSVAVHPPVGSGPPPEYDGTSPLLVLSEESGSSSHEVRCLSAPSAPRVRRHDECQPAAAFRPQVFSTSRRFAPRDALRACFISLARLGFPLQGFPFPGSRTSSRRPRTLLPLPAVFLIPCGSDSPWDRLQGLAPPGSPLLDRLAVHRPGARCPPGFSPLQGTQSFGRGSRFRDASPLELGPRSYGTSSRTCSPGSSRTEGPTGLSRDLPTLLRFRASSGHSLVRRRDRTGLMFSPETGCHVTVSPLHLPRSVPCSLPQPSECPCRIQALLLAARRLWHQFQITSGRSPSFSVAL